MSDDGRPDLRDEFITPLDQWFETHQRDLPWRRDRSGYTALVAETMLQQTQVARIVEAFPRFMKRFPTVAALAAADEQDVLALWQGLGYYRRARNLHAAAQSVMTAHDGAVPRTVDALRSLPGVGRYTAGAIASIVHGDAAAIVDGNVQRVLARWTGDDRPPTDAAVVRETWEFATRIAEASSAPGVTNEALMELGALVCTPRGPRCEDCPVRASCRARALGRQEEIPAPKPAARRREEHHHAVVVRAADRVLFERRPADGMWSNMWQVPTIEASKRLTPATVRRRLSIAVTKFTPGESFVHQTTHRLITFHVYDASAESTGADDVIAWRTLDDLSDLPLSAAQRRIVDRRCELPVG